MPTEPETTVFAVEDIQAAMKKLGDTRHQLCPHYVHPRFTGYRLAKSTGPGAVWAYCGGCGARILIEPA